MNLPKPFTHSLFLPWYCLPGGSRRRVKPPVRHAPSSSRGCGGPPAPRHPSPSPGQVGNSCFLVTGRAISHFWCCFFLFQTTWWRRRRKYGDGTGSRGARGSRRPQGGHGEPIPAAPAPVVLHNRDTCRFRLHSHVLYL